MFLTYLQTDKPPYLKPQTAALAWLSKAYARASQDKSLPDYEKLLDRVACRPPNIETRAHYSPAFAEDSSVDRDLFPEVADDPGAGTTLRMKIFEREAGKMISALFAEQPNIAPHLLHVTCTGYVAPSPAEKFVLGRGLHSSTVVTHLYHMGCYASIPALRMAEGLVATGKDVDVVHTELCTLHLQPRLPTLERMVIESLFADGGAKYRLTGTHPTVPHFKVLSLRQQLLPETSDLMAWVISEFGMEMSLRKEVPKAIHQALRGFQDQWLTELGMSLPEFQQSSFAVHPGGPRIIDQVKESLELPEHKLTHSRRVLRERGNMSSVTLPHIWKAVLDDVSIPNGEKLFCYAFGPGLTVAGALLEKRIP